MSRHLCKAFSALTLGCAVVLTAATSTGAHSAGPTAADASTTAAIIVGPDPGAPVGDPGDLLTPMGEGVWP